MTDPFPDPLNIIEPDPNIAKGAQERLGDLGPTHWSTSPPIYIPDPDPDVPNEPGS